MLTSSVLNAQLDTAKLQKLLNKSIDNKQVFGSVLKIETTHESWHGSAGNISKNQPYFIASTTKLYTTVLIMMLVEEGKLTLEDNISKYLPEEVMKGLHVLNGIDYSNQLTIKHLLSQTSGLPDYFSDYTKPQKSLYSLLTQTKTDTAWTFESCIALSKTIKPKFAPGFKKKAHYSDTNFQLLGKIIESICNQNIAEVYDERIFKPLGLKQTYLFVDAGDKRPVQMYYKKEIFNMPLAMSSFGPDGGIVSTAAETQIFLKAFFKGELFPKEKLESLYRWNAIFFPLEYGIGLMRFSLPRIFSPFKPVPYFIGHSGLSGAFAYYVPEKDVFVSGTVNQVHNPSLSYQLIIKALNCVK